MTYCTFPRNSQLNIFTNELYGYLSTFDVIPLSFCHMEVPHTDKQNIILFSLFYKSKIKLYTPLN